MSEVRIKIVEEHRRHSSDTGSVEVQCALLTHEIGSLTKHLKEHPADFQNRRALIAMVNKRKRLLSYLKRKCSDSHAALLKKLGLKK